MHSWYIMLRSECARAVILESRFLPHTAACTGQAVLALCHHVRRACISQVRCGQGAFVGTVMAGLVELRPAPEDRGGEERCADQNKDARHRGAEPRVRGSEWWEQLQGEAWDMNERHGWDETLCRCSDRSGGNASLAAVPATGGKRKRLAMLQEQVCQSSRTKRQVCLRQGEGGGVRLQMLRLG